MSHEQILVDVDEGGIMVLTLNRPDRGNAFTLTMAEEVIAAFDAADADDAVRAVVITGAGKSFCVGADLAGGGSAFVHDDPAYRDKGGRVTLRIFDSLKPVVAAVNGAAVGIGASMILAADVRLAADAAKFGFAFARRGIVLDGAASWFLPRAVGMSTALEWSLSGRVFPAAEAAAAGLVRAPVPAEALLQSATDMAHSLVDDTAPVSAALVRQMLWRLSAAPDPMAAHIVESGGIRDRGSSDDAKEGVAAFLERRASRFPLRVSADMPAFFPWWADEPFVPLATARTS